LDGASIPYGRSVDPIVRTHRIGLSLLATDRCVDQAIFSLVHHFLLGSSQASVMVLSMTCRWTLAQFGQVKVRKSLPIALGSIAVSFMGDPHAVHWDLDFVRRALA
jgi:hypothetical protein